LRRTRPIMRNPRSKRHKQIVTPAPQKARKIPPKGIFLEDRNRTCPPFWNEGAADLERLRRTSNLIGFRKEEVNRATRVGRTTVTMSGHSPTVSKAMRTTACLAAGDLLIIRCAMLAANRTTVATTKTSTAAGEPVPIALNPAVISFLPAPDQ